MPRVMWLLATVGTAAMLWVGGGILLHGADELGLHHPAALAHGIQHAVQAGVGQGVPGGVAGWLAYAGVSAVVGLVVGTVLAMVVHLFGAMRRGAGD
jgi:predicted DNA repair protein MutK